MYEQKLLTFFFQFSFSFCHSVARVLTKPPVTYDCTLRRFCTIFEALRTPCLDECYNLISGARKIRFLYRCACTRSAGGRVICAVRHYIQYAFYSRPAAYYCKRDNSFRENNTRNVMFVLRTVISRGKLTWNKCIHYLLYSENTIAGGHLTYLCIVCIRASSNKVVVQ